MIHRRKRLVDGIWIRQRMNEQDARFEAELRRKQPHLFAPPAVVDVAIEPARPDDRGPVVDVVLSPKPAVKQCVESEPIRQATSGGEQ